MPVAEQFAEVWSRDDSIPERIALVSVTERHGKVRRLLTPGRGIILCFNLNV